ncbi:MAG: T9SS type A sorting domain-containing protein [Flavobacteriales bacterium]|nr:T9SS type A sorting domain-containing protein [Flavobacteriales bacterium]
MSTIFLVLTLQSITQAQTEITFTLPGFGTSFHPDSTVNVALTATDAFETIDSVELVINHGTPELLSGPDYGFSYADLSPGYYLIEATAYAGGAKAAEELPIVIMPEEYPALPTAPESNGKLKIFIMVGQSNMVGHGQIRETDGRLGTLDYYVETQPEDYAHFLDSAGNRVVRDDVWDAFISDDVRIGWHKARFGADGTRIGPEYGFGNVMGDYYEDPVMILKIAWGGKSLGIDFLSPGSWDYNEPQNPGDTSYYYDQVMNHIKEVIGDLSNWYLPTNSTGHEIVGFAWHQGWNDRIDADFVDAYEDNMVQFIKDLRTELTIDSLPFVIANSGFSGWDLSGMAASTADRVNKHVNAQLAIADHDKYPEFENNTGAVDTRAFMRGLPLSPSEQSYHWYRNFETYYLIGEALAHAMIPIAKYGETFSSISEPTKDAPAALVDFKVNGKSVEVSLQNGGKGTAFVYTTQGQQVHREEFNDSATINLNQGIYLVKVIDNNCCDTPRSATKKVAIP